MPAFRVRLRSPGMREVLNGAPMARDMLARAERGAAAARAAAPVDTGAYRDSIDAEVVHTDRAVGRYGATVPYALVVEAKTRTLGRAIDAAG